MDDFRTFLNDAPGHVHPKMSRQRAANGSMVYAPVSPRPSGGRCASRWPPSLPTIPHALVSVHTSRPDMPWSLCIHQALAWPRAHASAWRYAPTHHARIAWTHALYLRCISGLVALKKTCRHYKHINFEEELPDMARSAVNLPSTAYFQHAMGHKFCVAAPGDFVSTPKITEYVAMGAAGGCLPLLVVKGPPEKTLPYTRWLDWCSIAYIVSDVTARTQMASVLRKLEGVSATEAEAKRRALLEVCSHSHDGQFPLRVTPSALHVPQVRDAFVWRAPAERPLESPSAVDFLLGDLCDAARSARVNGTLASSPLAGGSYDRCML